MNTTSAIIVNFLKKKNTLIGIGAIIIFFLISLIISSIYKQSIRAQEIDAVVQINYKNKQFKSVNESEFQALLKSQELIVVGLVEPSDNPSYDELNAMFNQKETISKLPNTVYIYEPIYNQSKIKKKFNLKAKNTFFVIDEQKEIGHYSFNKLDNGYMQLVKQIDTIIHPKIERKNPIRNGGSSETDEDETSEISATDSE